MRDLDKTCSSRDKGKGFKTLSRFCNLLAFLSPTSGFKVRSSPAWVQTALKPDISCSLALSKISDLGSLFVNLGVFLREKVKREKEACPLFAFLFPKEVKIHYKNRMVHWPHQSIKNSNERILQFIFFTLFGHTIHFWLFSYSFFCAVTRTLTPLILLLPSIQQ